MRRRELFASVGSMAGSLAALPHPAAAQAADRVYRVGILRQDFAPVPPAQGNTQLRAALRELGYIEGRNLLLDERYAGRDLERLPALAREMVQAKPDVIVAVGALPARAVKAATTSVPIVMYGNFDPIELGLVGSLARPGGNLTGVLIAPDGTMAGKRLELLSLAVPRARRIALLFPAPADRHPQVQETRKAATELGIDLIVAEVHGGDYASAFAAMQAQRPGALLVGATQYFARAPDRKQIIELAAKHRLPAMYEWRYHVADGGLMTYGTSEVVLSQRIAAYVDRILKGAKPGDLPIERPTSFQFVVNLKTAKALGLALPASLMLRVDEVIE